MSYYDDSPQFLTDYLNYITTIKARSELTRKNYYTDLRLFLRFLKVKNSLVDKNTDFNTILIYDTPAEIVKNVRLEDLLEFLTFTATDRDNQSKARSRKAVALRQFFKYLTDNKGWFAVSPAYRLELPSPKNALPKHLTIEQATQLLQDCSEIKSWTDARDYCIVTFFLNCGMRLSELVGINVNDCRRSKDPATGTEYSFIKVLGKGAKERIIYLNEACVDAYNAYLSLRPETLNEKALFVSTHKNHKRISNRRVQQIIEEKLMKSGLDGQGFSVHKLRHTAATLMYQNGVDVRVLKEILGHENLDTTQIYTHVADAQIMNAMSKNPLSDKAPKPHTKNSDKD